MKTSYKSSNKLFIIILRLSFKETNFNDVYFFSLKIFIVSIYNEIKMDLFLSNEKN